MAFTKFPDEFWDLIDTTAEGLILLRILKQVGFDGTGVCFESRESMANACHVSKNTVTTVIESLEEKGVIKVERIPNKPLSITLLKTSAKTKIRPRKRIIHLFRDPHLVYAQQRGENDYCPEEYSEHEAFQVVKGRVEAFQDARNGVPSEADGDLATKKPDEE